MPHTFDATVSSAPAAAVLVHSPHAPFSLRLANSSSSYPSAAPLYSVAPLLNLNSSVQNPLRNLTTVAWENVQAVRIPLPPPRSLGCRETKLQSPESRGNRRNFGNPAIKRDWRNCPAELRRRPSRKATKRLAA
jgi:hypothetical protein